ncbi:MAG: hypothetical protein FWF53_03760 [Candidatus Azobacteroides sp.]|nr:hypothetical protein [Candidatus Azobacteroides sp.]
MKVQKLNLLKTLLIVFATVGLLTFQLGGNVSFTPIIAADHLSAVVGYYAEMTVLLSIYR